ncbi:MAG: pilus assembly protein PilM [Candidatus Jacksonbacteria bacterium]|jgi:type IV pilus assembly protein PilM|nr:pilus assembly protein PilM [Candidatus Jacksonbacteria bacterium]MBT6034629.1 pilus assembly protein PilM [Candidatus Jacksonbacteria bacterium]MBT6301572.1 pilus assembly protein PilM [Candidatus Jacksonbacteria bacterium]MBT6757079.1 pilus assembly protein PilM [Candidatus Jacksonbacteria bacterium]MBT6955102.1 pilus assembly protein PilM [Candidatus Jacksonbacteria bacterium]
MIYYTLEEEIYLYLLFLVNRKIMGLFSQHKNYIGIDFGTSSVKLVELTQVQGEPRLVTYSYTDDVSQIIRLNTPQSYQQLAAIVQDMCKKAHTQSTHVVAALPNFAVFSSVISVPSLKKDELESAIQLEAKKFVPMPIEETILDWRVIDKPEESKPEKIKKQKPSQLKDEKTQNSKSDHMEVLITAAPKTLVEKYLTIFKAAKLNLLSLETESFALARSLAGKDSSTFMIIDLGAISTDIILIENGVPVISRSIDVGGQTITAALKEHLGIDEKRAEQFKRDVGMTAGTQETEGMSRLIASSFQSVINEVQYTLDLYRNRNKGTVQKVVLAGGSAFLSGMPEYIEKALSLPVYIGDAWQQVSYPAELKPVLESLSPRFSIAIGLALRELV